jgi:hypothetical protein
VFLPASGWTNDETAKAAGAGAQKSRCPAEPLKKFAGHHHVRTAIIRKEKLIRFSRGHSLGFLCKRRKAIGHFIRHHANIHFKLIMNWSIKKKKTMYDHH